MKFFDEVKIFVKAGNGGNGCCSFRRVKYVPRGGPDGGNGGHGGSIILQAENNLNTLTYFHYQVHHEAKSGKAGSGQNKTGLSGDDIVLKVPIGTQVRDVNTDTLLFDLVDDKQTILIAQGGRGGIGNAAFKGPQNRSPRQHTKGEIGEGGWFKLRLKLISDVGIVGMPNAGKSSIISALTNAKSEVGDYQFTTTKPILGVLKRGKGRVVLCDVPGLIKDAHLGRGLGLHFLQHIERCSAIMHVIDATQDDVVAIYKTVKKELLSYNKKLLSEKREVVVFNKIDQISEGELLKKVKRFVKSTKQEPICISVANRVNLNELVKTLFDIK